MAEQYIVRIFRESLLLLLTCSLASPIPAIASEPISITTPSDLAEIRPNVDVPIEYNVDPSAGIDYVDVIMEADNTGDVVESIELTAPNFSGTFKIPNNVAGIVRLSPIGRSSDNQTYLIGSETAVVVSPDSPVIGINVTKGLQFHWSNGMATPSGSFIRTFGEYADGIGRYISEPELGVTYVTGDSTVASVSGSGVVTPTGAGTTYVTVSVGSLKSYTSIRVEDDTGTADLAIDCTSKVKIQTSGIRFNGGRNSYSQTVYLRNISNEPIPRTVTVFLTNLPPGVELLNRRIVSKNVAPVGSPGVSLDNVISNSDFIAPGETETATVEFRNYEGEAITYTVKVVSGSKL